jgi:hypothetical protein
MFSPLSHREKAMLPSGGNDNGESSKFPARGIVYTERKVGGLCAPMEVPGVMLK